MMKSTEWNLNDFYATEEDVSKECKKIEELIEEMKSYQGKLNTEKAILEFLEKRNDADMRVERIFVMRYLKKDENVNDSESNKKFNEINDLNNKVEEAKAFFKAELIQNSDEFLSNMYEKEPGLKLYQLELDKIIEEKKHLLSKETEAYIASTYVPYDIFSVFENGDLKLEKAIDSAGNEVEMSHAKYLSMPFSPDAKLRKTAFESMHGAHKDYAHTYTKIFLYQAKKKSADAKFRKYNSSIEKEMQETDSTIAVYNSTIEAVNSKMELNHRYLRAKKAFLGLDKMYVYDINAPKVLEAEEKKYSYEEAQKIILEALKPLGKEYTDILKQAFKSNWAHVYPQTGKAGGAYCYGAYGCHPFVLLNYEETQSDVSTTVHEFGHAMHDNYSFTTQPYQTSRYTIMVAEVASITNEMLLAEYFDKTEVDKNIRINNLARELAEINMTIFRQTMFAEFEKWIFDEIDSGKQLSCEDICNYYGALVKKYMGDAVEETPGIEYEWARIPHFYTPFYVYKYATGMASAISISQNILEQGEAYASRYIDMLKMGGSKKPLDELRSVGIDLETPYPMQKALEYYGKKIEEFERLIKEI